MRYEVPTTDYVEAEISPVRELAQNAVKYHGLYFDRISETYEISISYDVSTRTLTITPSSSTFRVYIDGVKYTFSGAKTISHTATEGGWFFFYNKSGVLTASQTPWSILEDVPVAFVYYDASTPDYILLDERHHHESNKEWHNSQHFAMGTYVKRSTDFVLGNYTIGVSSDAAVTWSLGTGTVVDEDINTALSAVSDGGPYQTWAKSGANGNWRRTQRSYPYHYNSGTGWAQYNQLTGGSWQLTDLANNEHVNYYLFAVPALDAAKQIVIIPGQQKYSSLTLAQAESLSDLDLSNFPSQEFVGIWKITMRADTGGGATGKVQIVSVAKLTSTRSSSSTGGTAPTIHNSLSGRSDADTHPASSITNTPAGNIAAVTVQAAINELDSEKEPALGNPPVDGYVLSSTVAGVRSWVAAGGAATDHNTLSNRSAANAHPASSITNTAAGNIVATDVQAALNELDSEKGGLALNNTWTGTQAFTNATASTSTSTGAVTITGGLGVGGATYIGGQLTVTNGSGGMILAGGAIGSGIMFNDSSVAIKISAANTLSFYTSSTEGAKINNNGDLAIRGAMDVNSNTQSTSTSTGALTVAGGAGIVGNIYTSGELNVSNGSGGTILVGGAIGSGINFNDSSVAIRISAANTLSFYTSSIEALKVKSDATVESIGVIKTTNSTASTSTTTGALVVTGGAGVGGSLYTGGPIFSSGNFLRTGSSGTFRGYYWRTGTSDRWGIFANNTAEGGSNSGSDWELIAYDDSATAIDVPIRIFRAAGGIFYINRDVNISKTTASTTTTSGALVVLGGVGCGDYFTGKYRSSDGTAGLTATRTFYAASSSGGAVNVLNTVTIKDGIITAWTQA